MFLQYSSAFLILDKGCLLTLWWHTAVWAGFLSKYRKYVKKKNWEYLQLLHLMWKQPYIAHNMFTIKLKQLSWGKSKTHLSSRETLTGRTCGFHAIHLPRQPNSMCNSNENVQMSKISTESAAFPSGAVFICNSCFYISLPRFSGSKAIQKNIYIYLLKKKI